VAGLQAIATARRLGAVVTAYDTRSAVREQVESLGAQFVDFQVTGDAEAAGGYARELTAEEQQRQRELMGDHVAGQDVVITTALVPGRTAPVLVPTSVVERMRDGSVVVDLASAKGGNVEPSVHGEEVVHAGVRVLGPDNLPGGMPVHASQLFAKNVANLLALVAPEAGAVDLDSADDVVRGTLATRGGEVVHPLLRERYGLVEAEGAGR
jgi:NAD(P) transhydrogenase subunit alpha